MASGGCQFYGGQVNANVLTRTQLRREGRRRARYAMERALVRTRAGTSPMLAAGLQASPSQCGSVHCTPALASDSGLQDQASTGVEPRLTRAYDGCCDSEGAVSAMTCSAWLAKRLRFGTGSRLRWDRRPRTSLLQLGTSS